MKKVIWIFLISIFAACVTTSKFEPTAAELPALQSKVPGLTYDDAMRGYKLYTSHCSNCHRLHNPNEFTATKWNKVLPEMFDKAKLSSGVQQQYVRDYLESKAK